MMRVKLATGKKEKSAKEKKAKKERKVKKEKKVKKEGVKRKGRFIIANYSKHVRIKRKRLVGVREYVGQVNEKSVRSSKVGKGSLKVEDCMSSRGIEGMLYQIPEGTAIITRSEKPAFSQTTAIHIDKPGVSNPHCALYHTQDSFCLTDLGSTNGTLINSSRCRPYEEYPITNGDVISFGTLCCKYSVKE
eukprot:TRINITY_DN24550_c0_g1_i1.p1 TRINITY_DN24550_c0_g1~~TRINITY_DN24550_c0_g1_i1.p1  ORF type:complete len:209 (+),score=45.71 TRINITY_DN24550_c0_g1_i1:60-629(+)